MMNATKEFLTRLEAACDSRRDEIRGTTDEITAVGTTYYVSETGDDTADGLTPETAWRSLGRVLDAPLSAGDCVRFKRGDLFRGQVRTKPGVT